MRKTGLDSQDSSLLINAGETLRQLEYKVEDGLAAVKAAAVESKIVAEFRDLVEKGRTEFSRELRSILPHVPVTSSAYPNPSDRWGCQNGWRRDRGHPPRTRRRIPRTVGSDGFAKLISSPLEHDGS